MKNLIHKEATRRWKAQFIGEASKLTNKSWNDFLLIRPINKKDPNYEKDLKAYLNAVSKVDQFIQTKQGLSLKDITSILNCSFKTVQRCTTLLFDQNIIGRKKRSSGGGRAYYLYFGKHLGH